MNKHKLIVFVKAPVPGIVKTRLVPPLSHDEAANLYKSWAGDIFQTAKKLERASIQIAYAPHPLFPDPGWIAPGVNYFLQTGNDLGEKLANAFDHDFKKGTESVVIIGSDSPGLPLNYLQEAFAALNHHDLVLGPTEDGGYYLIGLKNQTRRELFEKISWSTHQVFSQTLTLAQQFKLSIHILPEYFDVDRAEDLKRIKKEVSNA